jgi:rhodanese-related sulfurtransferase
MKRFKDLISDVLPYIRELMPWDLEERIQANKELLLIDITEPAEFNTLHIPDAINVPRGILESASDWGYEDTVPTLAAARDREVVLICRSGNRSALAAYSLQQMGFKNIASLKTGLRGWFDYDMPLLDGAGNKVDESISEEYFSKGPREDQLEPK